MKITLADCFLVLCVAQCTLSRNVIDPEVDATIKNAARSGSLRYAIFSFGQDRNTITTEKEGIPTSWDDFVSDLTNDNGRVTPCAYGLIKVDKEIFDTLEPSTSYFVSILWAPGTFRSYSDKIKCTSYNDIIKDHMSAGGINPMIEIPAGTTADLAPEVAILV